MARILLIEDNPADAFPIQHAIATLNPAVAVVTVQDGEHATELLIKGEPFNLVLLDLNLPVFDGFQLLQRREFQGQTGAKARWYESFARTRLQGTIDFHSALQGRSASLHGRR